MTADVSKKLDELSPEKRALLLEKLRLREQARQVAQGHAGDRGDDQGRDDGALSANGARISRRADLTAHPLSYAQQRLWILSQLQPDSPFYNVPLALRLQGELDAAALERSLNEIVRRHEVLRASFATERGNPVQVIAPELVLALKPEDAPGVNTADATATATALAAEEARRPFDLTAGPLVRGRLLRLGQDDHLLLLTFHHIVTDGWSTGVLVRELTTLYRAYATGMAGDAPSLLPPLDIQYADYAVWQREQLRDDKLKVELAYWKEQLAGVPPLLELPTDRPRPATQTVNGDVLPFELSAGLAQRLRQFAHSQGATLYQVLLAGFQALLHRYTNQDDICVGTPIANRTRVETEGLIGFFVNTLVMRGDFGGNPSFRSVLSQLKERSLSAQSHQDVPFEMLVDETAPQRNLAFTPIFQVMFTLEQREANGALSRATGRGPALSITPVTTHSGTAKFDITLLMADEAGQRLTGSFEYNVDLFDKDTIRRMSGHFEQVLAAAINQPDLPVGYLPMLTEGELAQFAAWDTPAAAIPQEPVHVLFEQWAAATPDALAAVFIDGPDLAHLTYGELNARANRLAHWLIRQGVGPETLVGIAVERSLDMIVALLAILKAGGAYLPLDPSYPADRLQFMLADSRVRRVLTHSDLLAARPWLLPAGGQAFCLDRDWPQVAELSDLNPGFPQAASGWLPDALAYVIYTSGSTGRPKGVLIGHQGLTNLVCSQTEAFGVSHHDRVLQFASFSFDAATSEIFMALTTGAALYLAPRDTLASLADLRRVLQVHAITTVTLPPSLLAVLNPAGLDALACLVSAGERLSMEVAVRWASDGGTNSTGTQGRRLFNAYGPTEATVGPTLGRVTLSATGALPAGATSAPVGRPIPNIKVELRDRYGNLAPVGGHAELWVGGVGVARGYLGRPDLTAERFIPAPGGVRFYRTGDLARYLPDGQIEILGRIDQQVKLRGFRVELGEIQAVLERHDLVRQAYVMVRGDNAPLADGASGGMAEPRIVAYIVPKDMSTPPSVAVLRDDLRQQLPEYMVPSTFVFLERLPVNANGKVDRAALPAPDLAQSRGERPYIAPRSPVERFLMAKWLEVLRPGAAPDSAASRISVTDNFFELGGNSLQAAVLTNRIQEELGVSAHMRALFMAPTVADLAMYLDEYYPEVVARIAGIHPIENAGAPSAASTESASAATLPAAGYTFVEKARAQAKINDEKVAQFKAIVPPLQPRMGLATGGQNPPAVFVLSPPRSGSTLLRVMLAGNPQLFAPPELDLLSFNTLAERRAAFAGKYQFWLEGPVKAIMELRTATTGSACSVEEAEAIMADFEAQAWSTKQFYRQIQGWIQETGQGKPRLLVDKTPVYPMDFNILQRMEEDFDAARYIHLVRHPFATIYSFIEAKLEEVFFRWDHPFTMRELAELVYLVSHQNILRFLESIPAERQHRIWFEDLVGDPKPVMESACDFLGIDFHPDMLEPYKGDKMTSGIRPGHQMVGDFKFYLRNSIDPKAANRWKKFSKGDVLAPETWDVAHALGYAELEAEADASAGGARPQATPTGDSARGAVLEPITRGDPNAPIELSYAQQRLWFLDQFERGENGLGSAYYNVPAAVRLEGDLDTSALRQALDVIVERHQVLRTTFPTVHGRPEPTLAPELHLDVPVIDLRHLRGSEQEAAIVERTAHEAQLPFNLATGPLLRVTLLWLDGSEPAAAGNPAALTRGAQYVALVTMHHIVSDGWSINVFLRELAQLYAHFAATAAPAGAPLTPLPIQYSDFARWQRRWLEGAPDEGKDAGKADRGSPLQGQLDYWKQQLAGVPELLELPTDRPRPAVQSYHGARMPFTLSAELTQSLRGLSKQEGATLFMTLMAGFQALLGRYSGQDDIAVGTPVAGRNRPEIEGLIGFFVNTLVVRGDLSDDPSFRALLRRTKKTSIQAFENQDVPFEMLVEQIQPQRDMSHTPLFQVMFALQDSPLQTLKAPGLSLSPIATDTKTAKFDLTLSLVERTDVMRGALEYNTDLFNASTAAQLLEHLVNLLQGAVTEPDLPLSLIPILTPRERKLMLGVWNETTTAINDESTLAERFVEQARRTPGNLAVVAEYQSRTEGLTYAELAARSAALAARLRTLGIGPENIVGLMVDRSVEMLVGLMGILRAGAAYLPLDPAYPPDRLRFMLEDSGARVVVTQAKLAGADWLAELRGLEIVVIEDAPVEAGLAADSTLPTAQPDNLAYVIYTSGSTGRPKGVGVTHRTALNLAGALYRAAYAGAEPTRPLRLSLNAPLSFDASVQQLVMLTYGHTLVIIPQELRSDAPALLDFIRRQHLDQLDCVPSQLKLLLQAGLLAEDAPWTPTIVFPGGEAIDAQTWRTLASAPATDFYNMYGPTECTVDSTTVSARKAALRPTIGRPLANVRVYVLDRHMQPAPLGVPGELYIGGAGVARGYIERPDLTADRFRPDPFATAPGGRLYRTGDRVRWMSDGTLEFLGRVDHQVKVRGFRIELGEIEEALRGHPGIKEAVVLAVDAAGADRPAGADAAKRLVAYVEASTAGVDKPDALSTAELRRHLLATLPEYMVPAAFLLLDAMPLTPNGKIDRKALVKLSPQEAVRTETGRDYVAPNGFVETTLAEVYASVLGLVRVGVNDNFFELGGDSILTIQVVARAGQSGIHLTPKQIFQAPTVGQLALVAQVAAAGGVQAEQGVVMGEVPLTPIQQQFFEMVEGGRPHHWNQSLLLSVEFQMNPDALRGAVEVVLAHHDALRLRFHRVGGKWRQVNAGLDEAAHVFEYVNLSALDEPARGEALREHTLRLQTSLDIGAGPLIRVAYFDFGPAVAGRLLTVIHHLAIDRVSWRILLEDLWSAYEQVSQGRAPHLPAKTTAFRDWARRLAAYAQSPQLLAEAPLWLRLGREPIPALVLDYQGGGNLEQDMAVASIYLDEAETDALIQQIGKAYGTEVHEALLAALAMAFERWTGQPTTYVVVEGHGRQSELLSAPSAPGASGAGNGSDGHEGEVNLARTVGWFTSLHPVLLHTRGASAFGPTLMAVKEQLRAAPNGGIGYGLLHYLTEDESIRTAMRKLPRPQVSFNYLGQFIENAMQTAGGAFGPARESSGPDHAGDNRRHYLLDLTASVLAGKLRVEFIYSQAQFAAETIEMFGEFYAKALRGLIEHCLSPEAGGYTASDFADAGLNEADVQDLLIELGEIES